MAVGLAVGGVLVSTVAAAGAVHAGLGVGCEV